MKEKKIQDIILNPVYITGLDIDKQELDYLAHKMLSDDCCKIVFAESPDDIPKLVRRPVIVTAADSSEEALLLANQIKERNPDSLLLLVIPDDAPADMLKEIASLDLAGIVGGNDLRMLLYHISVFVFRNRRDDPSEVLSSLIQRGYIPDTTESMISVIGSDLRYRGINSAFCQAMSVTPKQVIGRYPSELWGKDVFSNVIQNNLKRCLKGEVIKYKARFSGVEFEGRSFEVIYRPWQPEGTDKNLSVVETREITQYEEERKSAVSTGLRSNYLEKYLPFGLFDCDRTGKILFANRTFFNIAGISEAKDDTGLYVESLFPADKRFTDYLSGVVKGESSTFGQVTMRRSDGTDIFVRITSHARPDPEHGVVVNSVLEETTREVTLERKLSSIHRMETLGTLAGGIAHDFNTILTTISGYAELTREETGPDTEIYNYMMRISGAVRKAEAVINQMLTFSRQVDQERVAVGIVSIIREACDFVSSASPENVLLQTDLSADDLIVLADPTQLFRVFLNIMTNGVQSMEHSGGFLNVTAERDTTDNRQNARIVVSDTGSGIESSVIDHIFEPFFTTKDVGKGTGMGLSVAHGIITSLGGEMEVESKPGTGTRFTILLPLVETDKDGKIQYPGDEHRTVLYADTDIYFSRTLSLALEKVGFRVLMATTPEDITLMTDSYREDISISILRSGRDSDTGELMRHILAATGQAPMVLIAHSGIDHLRLLNTEEKKRVAFAAEPVSLRDILNAINENC
ncbi:MAG: ATP-binding protein [Bacteroidales bacterium]